MLLEQSVPVFHYKKSKQERSYKERLLQYAISNAIHFYNIYFTVFIRLDMISSLWFHTLLMKGWLQKVFPEIKLDSCHEL